MEFIACYGDIRCYWAAQRMTSKNLEWALQEQQKEWIEGLKVFCIPPKKKKAKKSNAPACTTLQRLPYPTHRLYGSRYERLE
jgi:hypothetical protein